MSPFDLPPGEGRAPLWQLCPELGPATEAFSATVQADTRLPVRVAEAARMRVAELNGCQVCRDTRVDDLAAHGMDEAFYTGVGDPDLRDRYAPEEALAIEFAERFVAWTQAFDEPFWSRMRATFEPAEIVALVVSTSKWLALGRINAVLDLAVACPVRLSPSAR
ncbi:carboxymuconolactone decarboxylase family protein [Pseudonocardia benzenivorans]|uniref:Carboxymuconolactone decarboxylase family protein n=1 Tax=Pseudonocardia benzenivorans TaxID=228005 RepID=A0ABW3VRF2_9PSEU